MPTTTAKHPSPNDPLIIKVDPSETVNLYPNYYGIVNNNGYKTESNNPNNIDIDINPN